MMAGKALAGSVNDADSMALGPVPVTCGAALEASGCAVLLEMTLD